MWEDLCQLEGHLGMRYLTHETEDHFWTSHGAKPHPLAKDEAEKRTQFRLEQQQHQQQSLASTPSNSTANSTANSSQRVTIQDDQLSNGSYASNTSSKQGSDVGVFTDSPSRTLSAKGEDQCDNIPSPTPSQKSRKDYSSMTDEEVLQTQEHAKRVGYKVSTV